MFCFSLNSLKRFFFRGELNQIRTFALPAHGPKGVLVDLSQKGDALTAMKEECLTLPEVVLSKRQLCDIELLMNGGFSPPRRLHEQSRL